MSLDWHLVRRRHISCCGKYSLCRHGGLWLQIAACDPYYKQRSEAEAQSKSESFSLQTMLSCLPIDLRLCLRSGVCF